MDKSEIAEALRETGVLLKAKGENAFKAKAYIAASRVIRTTPQDIAKLAEEGRLQELPGIGSSLEKYIIELLESGSTNYLLKLRDELPQGTFELSSIDGLTLKRIAKLNSELNVSTIAELKEACEQGRVASLKGFGVKLQNDILQKLSGKTEDDRMRLVQAFEVASELVEFLKGALKSEKVEIAGTIRRWHEAVDKVTIVAQSDPEKVRKALSKYPTALSLAPISEDSFLMFLAHGIPAEVVVVSNLALGMISQTGSPEHFVQLQTIAKERAIELTKNSLIVSNRVIMPKSEDEVFKLLGLNFIPPELREGTDEVSTSVSGDFSELVTLEDIRGMTHCHSDFSDGIHTIEQMVLAAQKMGMEYITITDHSPTAHYAGGLSIDRLKEQWEEIDRVQESVQIKILRGTECDILADGRLDYPDHILEKFDIIIASIHSRYRQNEEAMTKRLLTGLRNPHFKVWGHPLGRIVLNRDPIPCDVENVLEAIADANVAIEINGDPYRLDLPPNWAKVAKDLGLKFVISTDAHARGDFRNLPYGIHMARRATIAKSQVLNTLPLKQFRAFVRPA